MRILAIQPTIPKKIWNYEPTEEELAQIDADAECVPKFTGYNSPLKKAFKKGVLGNKVYGIYGERLTQDNVSLEHIKPIAHGGKTELSNLLLADKKKNNDRGTKPIGEFVTIGMLRDYLKQFKDVKTSYFDGEKYIKLIRETFRKLVDE